MKSIRLSACALLLLLASCAMTGVPAFAATARVTVDVGTKDILSTNTLSLGENALVLVKNLGDSDPADLLVSLHDRRTGEILAGSTNFVADTTTSVWTNWTWTTNGSVPTVVSRTVTNAIGSLPLDTTNLFSRFVGLPVTAERTFLLSVYDSSNRWVLGQDDIGVKNAAVYGGLTNGVPVALFPDIIDHIADTNNPHRVTLEQLNQSDELGTLLFAYGINAWLNEGLKYITWTDHRVDLENGTFYGPWNFSTYPPAYEGAKLLTTNDIAPSFTNGTAPSLILSGIPYSRIVNDGLLSLPGVFYVGEPYDQLFVKPAGETASILTLSQDMAQFSKDLRVLQNLSADSFTLDGSTNKLEVLDGDLTYGGEPIGNGQGSGFPLTNSADFASFAATNVGSIQLAGSTNELAVEDGRLRWGGKSISGVAKLKAGRNIELSTNETTEVVTVATDDDVSFDDVVIHGNLEVVGDTIQHAVINQYTTINHGTNHVTNVVYSTNYSYSIIVTNHVDYRTNYITHVTEIGSVVNYSQARSVSTPSFSIDNSNTNLPSLAASGEWDFTFASIDFGSNLPDLSDYATQGWVESYHATNTPDLSGYVTSEALAEALEGYAPAGDITILTNSIARHILPAEFSPGDGGVEVDGFVTDVYSDTAAKLSTTLVLNDYTPTNQVTFEDWRGSVQAITVDSENGYAGTFDAAPDPRVGKYCNFLVSGTNTAHYITDLDGTSVAFSPPLETGQTYSVSAIRAVALDDFGLHSGSFNSESLAFSKIPLPASVSFQSISTPDGVSLFFSANSSKLYRSSDRGSNWVVVCESNSWWRGAVATSDGVTIYFTDSTSHLLRTSDGGQNWASIMAFPSIGNSSATLASVGDTLFLAHSDSGLYRSFDAGDTFEHLTPNIGGIWAIATHDGIRLFAATTSGVYRSDDRGDSWTQLTNAPTPLVTNFRPGLATADGVTVYYSLEKNSTPALIKSTDSGETWAAVPGAPSVAAYGTAVATHDGKTLFFSPSPGNLYRASPLGTTTATTPSTSVVTPVTNIVRGIYDIAVTTAGGGTTYWTLETAPDEWSIWSGSESPMGWRTVAQATNGIWSVRATNGMVQTAATCAEEAISLALTTNYLNRASKNAYSPYYGFSAFGGGIPMRWACTFIPISSALSNAPTVTGFSTLFSKYHNAMHWDTSRYNVELLSTNPVRSSVSWTGDEETQSIIFYQKSQEFNP